MSGSVTNAKPGTIGPIAAGWTVELDALPHSASNGSPSTGVVSFSAVADIDAHLLLNNDSTFTYTDDTAIDMPDVGIGPTLQDTAPPPVSPNAIPYGSGGYGSGYFGGQPTQAAPTDAVPFGSGSFGGGYLGGAPLAGSYSVSGYGTGGYSTLTVDSSGQIFTPPGELDIVANVAGKVDSLSLAGATGSFTQGTRFTDFASRDMDIPAVTSGSPLAAYNLAWQMAGNRPWHYTNWHGTYWPLRGHDAGFDHTNAIVEPADLTTYRLTSDGKNVFRRWNVENSFASLGWDVADGEFWSTSGVGSSVKVGAKRRTLISGTTNLNGRSYVLQFGASKSGDNLGFGPDDAHLQYGKYFEISLHGPTSSATVTGSYRSGGAWVDVSKTASLTGVDMTAPVQFLVDIGYPTSTGFRLTVYIQNVDSTDSPVVISTGLLTTKVDTYAAPFKSIGYLHGLFVTWESYDYDESVLLGPYEDWSDQPVCDLDRYGIDTPILAYTGSLWDYLGQVCVARQVGIRDLSGQIVLGAMNDDSVRAQMWTPAVAPTFAIDNSSDSTIVEVDGKLVTFGAAPIIYNGTEDTQTFSVTPGTTAVFSITTTSINALIYNPEPLFDFKDFLTGNHPYGAYIVTASDNKPILPTEWISYGGSVTVAQVGTNTLTVTVVAPIVPLGVAVTGDYSLSVSDGSNSHPMLKLTSPAGGKVTDNVAVFQSGSSYAGPNSSTSTITNVAVTDQRSLQNAATWTLATAGGPTITLQGEFPLSDLRLWSSGDFGFIPGATVLYRNLQWRIMTATVSNLSVKFSAVPYVTYRNLYFPFNWSGLSVDDFTSFWEGKTYDDMATMMLAGPNYDWDYRGAVARYDLYPGGGTTAGDPGLLPDPLLQPDPLLEPDAPGTTIQYDTYPGSGEFPSRTEFTGVRSVVVIETGAIYPGGASLFPGSQEDPT